MGMVSTGRHTNPGTGADDFIRENIQLRNEEERKKVKVTPIPEDKDMTEQPQQPIITRTYTESPASWNTRYINAHGFECQLTLRGESGADLLKKADAAIQVLVNSGCAPLVNRPYQSGNGHVPEQPKAEPPKLADGTVDPTWCPIHSIAMKRHEKDGQVW